MTSRIQRTGAAVRRPANFWAPAVHGLLRHLQNCQALASQGIEPQATWAREGYLDTVRARINWTASLQIPLRCHTVPGQGIP